MFARSARQLVSSRLRTSAVVPLRNGGYARTVSYLAPALCCSLDDAPRWNVATIAAALLASAATVTTTTSCQENNPSVVAKVVLGDVTTDHGSESRQRFTVSLWAMPPLSVRNTIYDDIKKFAGIGGAIFEPHVTVVGGIECDGLKDAQEKAKRLQEELEKAGHLDKPLWCAFGSKVKRYDLWSQACCVVLTNHETSGFDDVVSTCLETLQLNPETGNWTYPTPLKKPHMSLHYSQYNASTPDNDISVYRIPSFKVDRLELWCTMIDTEGSNVKDDVHSKWYPIAVIPMIHNDGV